MFRGRSASRRIGCFSVVRNFTGGGVSEDAACLSRDWHFTVDAAKHRMGPFQEWPSFRGYGSMFLGRSAFRRMGCFSVVRNFTGWGEGEDGVFQRMQRFSVEVGISQSIVNSCAENNYG